MILMIAAMILMIRIIILMIRIIMMMMAMIALVDKNEKNSLEMTITSCGLYSQQCTGDSPVT